MKLKTLLLIFLALTAMAVINDADAQCAMCRATVESSVKTKIGPGQGLNTGILYLMTIPYLLIAVVGYLWYINSRKETDKYNRLWEILKRKLA